jgi:hypothetical protein
VKHPPDGEQASGIAEHGEPRVARLWNFSRTASRPSSSRAIRIHRSRQTSSGTLLCRFRILWARHPWRRLRGNTSSAARISPGAPPVMTRTGSTRRRSSSSVRPAQHLADLRTKWLGHVGKLRQRKFDLALRALHSSGAVAVAVAARIGSMLVMPLPSAAAASFSKASSTISRAAWRTRLLLSAAVLPANMAFNALRVLSDPRVLSPSGCSLVLVCRSERR